MKMAATHVLTINHVFDILKEYQEKKSWKETLEKVLPMRKGAQSAAERVGDQEEDEKAQVEEEEEEGEEEEKTERK
jgi:uncharacterized caspase-like protein